MNIKKSTCPCCNGSGKIEYYYESAMDDPGYDGYLDKECSRCDGTGKAFQTTCPQCNGSKIEKVTREVDTGSFIFGVRKETTRYPCGLCEGKGVIVYDYCYECKGKGVIYKTEQKRGFFGWRYDKIEESCPRCGGLGHSKEMHEGNCSDPPSKTSWSNSNVRGR
jgi:DnaJ-class molecular chaperone